MLFHVISLFSFDRLFFSSLHLFLGGSVADNAETQPVDVTAIPSPAQSAVAKSPELAAQEKRERYQGHRKQKDDTVELSPNATAPASGSKETKETKETELDFENMELFSDTEARGKECRNDLRIYITLQCLHFENHLIHQVVLYLHEKEKNMSARHRNMLRGRIS